MSATDPALRLKAVEALAEAWAKADAAGVPADVIAGVALAKAYAELTETLGMETAANIAARFPEQIRAGRFGNTQSHETDDD